MEAPQTNSDPAPLMALPIPRQPISKAEDDAAEKTVNSLLQQLNIEGDDVPLNGTATYNSPHGAGTLASANGTLNSTNHSVGESTLLTLVSGTDTLSSRSPANQSNSSQQQQQHSPSIAAPPVGAAATANGNATVPPRTITRKIDATGKNIFVNGLPTNVDDAALRTMFEKFGDIVSTHVLCDLASSKSRGMGFVHFADVSSVNAAVSEMNGHRFPNGSTLHVRVAYDDAEYTSEETNKLFVRHVSKAASSAELWQFFEQWGTVIQCTIQEDISAKGKLDPNPDNMAYVTYSTIEEANNALGKCVNMAPFGGRKPLALKRAESLKCRNQRLKRLNGGGSGQTSPQNSNTSPAGSGSQQQQQQQRLGANMTPIMIASPPQGLAGMSGSNGHSQQQMRMSGTTIPMSTAGGSGGVPTMVGFNGAPTAAPMMMAPQAPMMLAPQSGPASSSGQTISPSGSGVTLVPGPQIMYVVPSAAGGSQNASPNGSANASGGPMMMAPTGMQIPTMRPPQQQQQPGMMLPQQQQQGMAMMMPNAARPQQQQQLQGFGGANMSHLQQFRK